MFFRKSAILWFSWLILPFSDARANNEMTRKKNMIQFHLDLRQNSVDETSLLSSHDFMRIRTFHFKKSIKIPIVDSNQKKSTAYRRCTFNVMNCEALCLYFISWLLVWCQNRSDRAVCPSSESIICWWQLKSMLKAQIRDPSDRGGLSKHTLFVWVVFFLSFCWINVMRW